MFVKNVRFSQGKVHLLLVDAKEILVIDPQNLTPDEAEELRSGVQELMVSHQSRIDKLAKVADKLAAAC